MIEQSFGEVLTRGLGGAGLPTRATTRRWRSAMPLDRRVAGRGGRTGIVVALVADAGLVRSHRSHESHEEG